MFIFPYEFLGNLRGRTGWGKGMNQVRPGGSLGIGQVNEAGKNICKGSGKADCGTFGDLSVL